MNYEATIDAPTDASHSTAVAGQVERSVMRPVAVLFARADSGYKELPGVDVYDMERDARTFDGPAPVVAHPPCRGWGRLRQFAKPRADERNLARLAVALVREFGGVLEHPEESTLWGAQRLPEPGQGADQYGGWTLGIQQHDFGHRAEKATWLYIVGCAPKDIPDLPLPLTKATHCIRPTKSYPRLPSVTKAEREHTPPRACSMAGGPGQTLQGA
jgi:hypothetical protein